MRLDVPQNQSGNLKRKKEKIAGPQYGKAGRIYDVFCGTTQN
jgi:hypothetical protein